MFVDICIDIKVYVYPIVTFQQTSKESYQLSVLRITDMDL